MAAWNIEKKPYEAFKIGDYTGGDFVFTAENIAQFSDVTGDHNPIHLDPEFAAQTMFKVNIAQGFFVNSAAGAFMAPFCGAYAINMDQTWSCPAPTKVGDVITYKATIVEMVDEKQYLIFDQVGTNQDGVVVFRGKNRIKIMSPKKK